MFWRKKPVIEFFCHPDYSGVVPEPKGARKHMPQWFKRVMPTIPEQRDSFGGQAMTIKKCMPVLDAMSLGYIIPLVGDLGVQTNVDRSEIKITNPPGMKLAEFHNMKQVGGDTAPCFPTDPIKFLNPWIVKTAPGWSTLFIAPINIMGEQPFTCIGGLVDTDKYPKEVNFPAVWHADKFDDILPAGTPLVVAIPIHRASIPSNPFIRGMSTAEFKNIDRISKCQDSRRGHYTNELREPR